MSTCSVSTMHSHSACALLIKLLTYVDIESEYWVLLARALEASDLCLELMLGLLPLRSGTMIALGLLMALLALLALRRWLLLMVRGSLVILSRAWGTRLGSISVLRSCPLAVLRLFIPHITIVGVLAIG